MYAWWLMPERSDGTETGRRHWRTAAEAGLVGVGEVGWEAVLLFDGQSAYNDLGWSLYVHIALPIVVFLYVLLPVTAAASGVWLRRWVARSAATRPRHPS